MKMTRIALAFLTALTFAHNAMAFSTDQSSAQNSDGSAKFNDPDEQMPGFVVSPNTNNGALSLSPSSSVNMPTLQENDNGANAFNQAMAHQQLNK